MYIYEIVSLYSENFCRVHQYRKDGDRITFQIEYESPTLDDARKLVRQKNASAKIPGLPSDPVGLVETWV